MANRTSAIRSYISFCTALGITYHSPQPYHICWFLEHLARSTDVIGTITNTLGHIRTYFKNAAFNTAPLYSTCVQNAIRGLQITLRHVPQPKLPAPSTLLRDCLGQVGLLEYPAHIKLALIIMFNGFFRQSNVAAKTVAAFDTTRQFVRRDFLLGPTYIVVRLKWSKTLQKSSSATTVTLHAIPGSPLCPYKAFLELCQAAPTTHPKQPLLAYGDGNPMTINYISAQWSKLLTGIGADPSKLSLHSLRRGGALHAHTHGAALQDIKPHGTWASDAVSAYIRPNKDTYTTVHKAMSNI
jgi:hypothetical protein